MFRLQRIGQIRRLRIRNIWKVGAVTLGIALIAASCSSSSSSSAASVSPKKLTTVTVGAIATANVGDLYAGLLNGTYKKYGINLHYEVLTPTATVAAVDSGSIDIGDDGAAMVKGAIVTHSNKIFMSNGAALFYLAVPKSITTFSQLVGKTISASVPGGAIYTAIKNALAAHGITLGTGPGDVHAAYFSNNSSALAALSHGSVAGAMVSPPTTIQAEEEGMHLISVVPYSFDSIWSVNSSWASTHKSAIVDFLKAFAVSSRDAINNLSLCEQGIKKYVGVTNAAQLKGSCVEYDPYYAVEPMPSCQIVAIEKGLTPPQSVPPSEIVDNSYLNALGKKNWIIGKPAYTGPPC